MMVLSALKITCCKAVFSNGQLSDSWTNLVKVGHSPAQNDHIPGGTLHNAELRARRMTEEILVARPRRIDEVPARDSCFLTRPSSNEVVASLHQPCNRWKTDPATNPCHPDPGRREQRRAPTSQEGECTTKYATVAYSTRSFFQLVVHRIGEELSGSERSEPGVSQSILVENLGRRAQSASRRRVALPPLHHAISSSLFAWRPHCRQSARKNPCSSGYPETDKYNEELRKKYPSICNSVVVVVLPLNSATVTNSRG